MIFSGVLIGVITGWVQILGEIGHFPLVFQKRIVSKM